MEVCLGEQCRHTSDRSAAGSICSAGGLKRGGAAISGRRSTFRLGVKGSGRRMFLGKALRMRFLIWMQLGGTALHTCKGVHSFQSHFSALDDGAVLL